MLSTDLILNASTAIAVGTAGDSAFSLIGGGTPERTVRSDATVALTRPHELSISHQKRLLKGFKTTANAAVPAPDVVVDRHTIRLDYTQLNTFVLDTNSRCKSVVQITFEVPRLGTDTPSLGHYTDQLKRIVSILCVSGGANLQRILNFES